MRPPIYWARELRSVKGVRMNRAADTVACVQLEAIEFTRGVIRDVCDEFQRGEDEPLDPCIAAMWEEVDTRLAIRAGIVSEDPVTA